MPRSSGNPKAEKAHRLIDRDFERAVRQIDQLEKKLQQDIIGTLELRYDEASGWRWNLPRFDAGLFSGRLTLPGAPPGVSSIESAAEFRPDRYHGGDVVVEPLTANISSWATVVALRVAYSKPDHSLQLDWVNTRRREQSKAFLIDPEHDQYYYPLSTDLKGKAVAARPRVGLIAFEPFRYPTNTFELHFAGIESAPGSAAAFHFSYSHPDLAETIKGLEDQPAFHDRIVAELERIKAEYRKEVAGSGCALAGLILAGSVALVALL